MWKKLVTAQVTSVPYCPVLLFPADWLWRAGRSSSGFSVCHLLPHQYHSKQSSFGHWGPHYKTNAYCDFLLLLSGIFLDGMKEKYWYINNRYAAICGILIRLPDHMVDDDGLWRHQEGMQALRNLRELHSLGLENLQTKRQRSAINLVCKCISLKWNALKKILTFCPSYFQQKHPPNQCCLW